MCAPKAWLDTAVNWQGRFTRPLGPRQTKRHPGLSLHYRLDQTDSNIRTWCHSHKSKWEDVATGAECLVRIISSQKPRRVALQHHRDPRYELHGPSRVKTNSKMAVCPHQTLSNPA